MSKDRLERGDRVVCVGISPPRLGKVTMTEGVHIGNSDNQWVYVSYLDGSLGKGLESMFRFVSDEEWAAWILMGAK